MAVPALGDGATAATIIPVAYIAAAVRARASSADPRCSGGFAPKARAATAAATRIPSAACTAETIVWASSTSTGEAGVTARRRRIPDLR